jgi:hypothetical protein
VNTEHEASVLKTATRLSVPTERGAVSALLLEPPDALALLVLAHGAGAGMEHPLMASTARVLHRHHIATLRYHFPYMEAGGRRPDRAPVLEATVRAAVREAARLRPHLPLLAGGRSMGGRMNSRADAAAPLSVRGLVFFAFPLHPPRQPAVERAEHLTAVSVPMLFVTGTRDDLARLDLLERVTRELGERATLHLVEDGDHSFRVRKGSGRLSDEVEEEIGEAVARWIRRLLDDNGEAYGG